MTIEGSKANKDNCAAMNTTVNAIGVEESIIMSMYANLMKTTTQLFMKVFMETEKIK